MDKNFSLSKLTEHISSNGKLHDAEVKDWLKQDEANQRHYQELLVVWKLTGKFPQKFTPNRQQAWRKIQSKVTPKKKQIVLSPAWWAAASVAVGLFCWWAGTKYNTISFEEKFTEIVAPSGQKTEIVLPDNSHVKLNGGTRIRYGSNFGQKNRTLQLDGEAYFDVTKNPSSDFIVNTQKLSVKVHGTSFNLRAYQNDPTVEVGLKEGSIGIEQNAKEVMRMKPNDFVVLNKATNQLLRANENIEAISAWTKDELIFEEKPFTQITQYLERWYGVNIDVAPELYDNQLYTFKVKTESLHEVLELINVLKPINYQIDGQKVKISKP